MSEHSTRERSTGELIRLAATQFGDLLRSELRLAQEELAAKGRSAARGGALYGAAGALGYLGLGALVAGCVAALAYLLPLWAAALAVGGALLALAGLLATLGRRQAGHAGPVVPQQAVNGVKTDVEEIRERAVHHGTYTAEAARAGGDGTRTTG